VSLARLQGLDRSLPVWVVSVLALVVLMALPIGWIASLSVSGESGPTFAHYRRVFADPALQKALWNTIVLAFWVGLASIALGVPLAWLTARTDVPGRGVIRGLVMASFVTPPFLGAFAWVMLADPNAGLLDKLWRSVSGSDEALVKHLHRICPTVSRGAGSGTRRTILRVHTRSPSSIASASRMADDVWFERTSTG
jgi:ABC-type Fe3+ transport system permease subunit